MTERLSYHAMRLRWCRAALRAFVRRWAVYGVVGAAVFGAGASGGARDSVAALQGVCAWFVLPLFRAAVEPVWWVPAVLLQALVGAGLVWGMRPLLWPVRWAAAERALPLARADTLLSDACIVPLGLVPWCVPCAIGAHALIVADPPWLHAVRGRAIAALVFAMVGSVGLGIGLLQWLRRSPRAPQAVASTSNSLPQRGVRAMPPIAPAHWPMVLLIWPLVRGPARRSGRLIIESAVALCVPAIGLWRWPAAGGWWLAGYALAALVAVTRVQGLLRLELRPLFTACAPLPMDRRRLHRAQAALALTPLGGSGLALLAALPAATTRAGVLAAYVAAVLGSAVAEVRAAPAEPAAKASRWLFCIALMVALATEVLT